MSKELFVNAIEELKTNAVKRNFIQTVDFIVNFKEIDIKKTPISVSVILPHPPKESKICGFLEKHSSHVDKTITKPELAASWDKKQMKLLARSYDIFIASAPLMPAVATKFGRILGTAGKMPNPKTGGVIMKETEDEVKNVVERLKKTLNIRAKENSIKIGLGKENIDNEKIAENALVIYNAILNILPNRKENIRSVMFKLTMSKPVKIKEK